MWEFLVLIGLVIFRYEAALIHLFNRGLTATQSFAVLSAGMVFSTFAIHFLSGPRVLPSRIHFPRRLVSWLQRQKVVRSYLSYHRVEQTRKRERIKRLGDSVLKSFYAIGYAGIALIALLPIPLLRSATVVAARIARLKYGVYVILGSAELKLLLEVAVYYRFGKMIPFASKLTIWHLALIFFGGFIVYTAIGWLHHAVTDDHFNRHRFS